MRVIQVDGNWDRWKELAREALRREQNPCDVDWIDARARAHAQQTQTPFDLDFSAVAENPAPLEGAPPCAPRDVTATLSVTTFTNPAEPTFHVPRRFLEVARNVSHHRDERRWNLLYRLLWRITHGESHLLDISFDPDVATLLKFEKAVHHDVHKMRAFVRFREVKPAEGSWFVAWYEPDHFTLSLNVDFFRDRFAQMRWSILTPDESLHWDGETLKFTEGVSRSEMPSADAAEDLWRTYYRHTFNPARLKVKTMAQHMPRRFWTNMPETQDIPELISAAAPRVEAMLQAAEEKRPPTEFIAAEVPRIHDLDTLRRSVQACRACPLWKDATCTVFGEGPPRASVLVVGEQPGDQEDRAGRPFVGPAGQLLNRAFAAAGIDRSTLYVTNAVKHFKWTPSGKRRLHAKPNAREIAACRPWLTAEIKTVQPDLIVCLGATAARSVTGADQRVTETRGQIIPTEFTAPALLTLHPSALLRLPPGANSTLEFQRFVEDLQKILAFIAARKSGHAAP